MARGCRSGNVEIGVCLETRAAEFKGVAAKYILRNKHEIGSLCIVSRGCDIIAMSVSRSLHAPEYVVCHCLEWLCCYVCVFSELFFDKMIWPLTMEDFILIFEKRCYPATARWQLRALRTEQPPAPVLRRGT
jgi:hypothetical protein